MVSIKAFFRKVIDCVRRRRSPKVTEPTTGELGFVSVGFGKKRKALTELKQIAKGGEGIVFAISSEQKQIALKVQLDEDDGSIKREIANLKKLKHQNIVGFEGIFKCDKVLGVGMEYLSNTLRRYLKNETDHLEAKIVKAMKGVAKALIYIHSLGYVHCDIKPDNILVTEEGDGKLCDLASVLCLKKGKCKPEGLVAWTPDYIPGEYLERLEWTKKADIWSFGITMLSAFTKQRPYDCFNSDAPVTRWILTGKRPFISREAGATEEFVRGIVACLELDPRMRPTAEELLMMDIFCKD